MELRPHQLEAIDNLSSGKILHGGVGSGKTVTVLGYYVKKESPRDIYVITTAKKRDSLDWELEAAHFVISSDPETAKITPHGKLTVDSWNNLWKYRDVTDAFFVFDEQRLVGTGTWVTNFLKIAKKNTWVLLSATPGDTWMDYAPIFIADGFYKNFADFKRRHVLYMPFVKYPKIMRYIDEQRLEWIRNDVLVEMPFEKESKREINWLPVGYDEELFRLVYKKRWNPYENCPVKDVAELWRLMRRVVNSDPSRMDMLRKFRDLHGRIIVFYNFNYELDILRELYGETAVGEWNGHKKTPIPDDDKWVYLVHYVAGAEGWNCISTNAMFMFSLTYSYKNFTQAMGRIDRMNTLYPVLYYYIPVSNSVIDRAIKGSLMNKKSFHERNVIAEMRKIDEVGGDFLEFAEEVL